MTFTRLVVSGMLGLTVLAGLAGCSGESASEKALDTAAPPPSPDAKPDAPNPNKKRPPAPPSMGAAPGPAPAPGK